MYIQGKGLGFINSTNKLNLNRTKKLSTGYSQPRENILGVLFFSIAFAIALTKSSQPEQRRIVCLWLEGFNEAVLKGPVDIIIFWMEIFACEMNNTQKRTIFDKFFVVFDNVWPNLTWKLSRDSLSLNFCHTCKKIRMSTGSLRL